MCVMNIFFRRKQYVKRSNYYFANYRVDIGAVILFRFQNRVQDVS